MLFADLLSDSSFEERVQKIAIEFRAKAAIPFKINQLGIVVPDVATAARDLEKRGLGPFFIASAILPRWTERGEERIYSGKLGMAYHRGIELELLEPGTGSDFYRQSLDPQGKPKVQHVGFLTPKVDQWAEKLTAMDCPIWVRGKISAWPMTIDFAYMDSASKAGIIVEFIGYRLAGLPIHGASPLIRAAAWLLKRSGIPQIKY